MTQVELDVERMTQIFARMESEGKEIPLVLDVLYMELDLCHKCGVKRIYVGINVLQRLNDFGIFDIEI